MEKRSGASTGVPDGQQDPRIVVVPETLRGLGTGRAKRARPTLLPFLFGSIDVLRDFE
jgi:hypothetical protein